MTHHSNTNLQNIFHQILTQLAIQGEPAYEIDSGDNYAGCKYRVEKNGKTLKCAAGLLIPDGLYMPDLEKDSWHAINRRLQLGYSEKENILIGTLRWFHDNYAVAISKQNVFFESHYNRATDALVLAASMVGVENPINPFEN